jgi:hypothetical protein
MSYCNLFKAILHSLHFLTLCRWILTVVPQAVGSGADVRQEGAGDGCWACSRGGLHCSVWLGRQSCSQLGQGTSNLFCCSVFLITKMLCFWHGVSRIRYMYLYKMKICCCLCSGLLISTRQNIGASEIHGRVEQIKTHSCGWRGFFSSHWCFPCPRTIYFFRLRP